MLIGDCSVLPPIILRLPLLSYLVVRELYDQSPSALTRRHFYVQGTEVSLIGMCNEALEVPCRVLVLVLEDGLSHEGLQPPEDDDHDAKYDQVEESELKNNEAHVEVAHAQQDEGPVNKR